MDRREFLRAAAVGAAAGARVTNAESAEAAAECDEFAEAPDEYAIEWPADLPATPFGRPIVWQGRRHPSREKDGTDRRHGPTPPEDAPGGGAAQPEGERATVPPRTREEAVGRDGPA